MSKVNIDQIYLEIEQKIINLMLRHREIVAEMIDSNVASGFFNPKHRPIVQAIYYTFQISDGKRLLTDDHYRTLLIEQGGKGEITVAMEVYHECMHGVHFSNTKENFDLLKKQLIESFIHISTSNALRTFNKNLTLLGRMEATKQYRDDLDNALNMIEVKKQSSFMIIDELKDKYLTRLESKMTGEEKNVICNIPEIDEAMCLGFKPGHTTLIVGATGGNKTNLLLNIALAVHDQGENVLFLPLEMDWEDFVNRVISNVANIPYKHLLQPTLLDSDEHDRIKQAKAWISNDKKFALLDVDERLSVSALSRELEKRANYFAPRLVVVDYLGLLKTQSSFGERHDLALGELTKQLKFLGKKYNFHVLTAAQLGRADIKRLREQGTDAQLDSTSVKGSQEVASDCEFIFALTRVPDEDDRLKFHVIKSRYAPSGYTTDLRLDAGKCQISSMKPVIVSGGLGTDVLGDDDWLNESPKVIAEKIAKYKEEKPVVFDSMDPDDLDDVLGV